MPAAGRAGIGARGAALGGELRGLLQSAAAALGDRLRGAARQAGGPGGGDLGRARSEAGRGSTEAATLPSGNFTEFFGGTPGDGRPRADRGWRSAGGRIKLNAPGETEAGSPKEQVLGDSLDGQQLKTKFASLGSKPRLRAFAKPHLLLDKDTFIVRLLHGQKVIDNSR